MIDSSKSFGGGGQRVPRGIAIAHCPWKVATTLRAPQVGPGAQVRLTSSAVLVLETWS